MCASNPTVSSSTCIVVRGGNDIASAVAHRLFTAGFPTVILETPQPLTVRRGMAYASAVYDGSITLEGVTAKHARTVEKAVAMCAMRTAIAVLTSPEADALQALCPKVIVDARMRKKERSTSRVTDAPLVIGLGPGFTASIEAHAVIETNRGPSLGRIITEGDADAYTGEPTEIAGHSKDRYLYAPHAGVFRTRLDLGHFIEEGQIAGYVDDEPLAAKVGGMVRGIVKSGLAVQAGAKLVDIDPRGNPAALRELSPKAWAIADAVLQVVRRHHGR